MDRTEEHVRDYLLHMGLGPVVYEPDGNQPPDFLTADRTAVEVRRLNKHHESHGGAVALEYDAFPLLNGMRKLLASFGAPHDGTSWFVLYRYSRPVLPWREIAPAVRAALEFIDQTGHAPADPFQVLPRLSLHLVRASESQEQRFVLGGYADHNSGGWLMSDLQSNIQLCVDEKSRKIAPYRRRYEKWWLVLVDHIGLGSSAIEQDLFAEHVRITHDWDRVVLLSPRDHTRAVLVESRAPAA